MSIIDLKGLLIFQNYNYVACV